MQKMASGEKYVKKMKNVNEKQIFHTIYGNKCVADHN
jgi:hypothetical protein